MAKESGEGRGQPGSNKALADADCFLPPAVFLLSRLLPPHCPTPTPSSLKPLIPDSCGGCRQRWGKGGGEDAVSLLLLRLPPPPDSLGTGKAPPLSNSPGMDNSRNGPLLSQSPEFVLKPGEDNEVGREVCV